MDILWTFSQFCEGFAMVSCLEQRAFVEAQVPQYVFCYRDRMAKDIILLFKQLNYSIL